MIYTVEELTVYYKHEPKTTISRGMAWRRDIDVETLEQIKESHVLRYELFEKMENTQDPVKLREFAEQFENLEFLQQELWGLDIDRNFHCWYDVPNCDCPKLDNDELKGCDQRIINANCIIHGAFENS